MKKLSKERLWGIRNLHVFGQWSQTIELFDHIEALEREILGLKAALVQSECSMTHEEMEQRAKMLDAVGLDGDGEDLRQLWRERNALHKKVQELEAKLKAGEA